MVLERLLRWRPVVRAPNAAADPVHRNRNQALKRAGAAVGLALLLLLGMLAFEAERVPSLPPAATVPAAVSAVVQGARPAPALSAPASTGEAAQTRDATVSPALAPAASLSLPAAEPNAPPPVAAAPAPVAPPAVPLGDGFLIQLGVFGAQANAESLRAELAARGLPAHIESRVVLGPFPSREAAEAAQARLRRDGKAEGLIVPPRKPK